MFLPLTVTLVSAPGLAVFLVARSSFFTWATAGIKPLNKRALNRIRFISDVVPFLKGVYNPRRRVYEWKRRHLCPRPAVAALSCESGPWTTLRAGLPSGAGRPVMVCLTGSDDCPQFLPRSAPAWKTEQGVEFNALLDVLPMLLPTFSAFIRTLSLKTTCPSDARVIFSIRPLRSIFYRCRVLHTAV